jgi:putative NADH-flavin reductase
MHILVIGASRGIGLETTKAALAAGHEVRAFARAADRIPVSDPRLEKRRGDALNPANVDDALDGVDAVVQALGIGVRDMFRPVSLFSEATRILLPAMERRGVKRLIAITGFGAGESRSAIGCMQRIPFQLVFSRAYDDKGIQELLIKESGLDWTIVRPGVLTSGPRTGRYKVLADPSEWRNGIISRADVADFVVSELAAPGHVHQAPVLVRF